ncbi:MAG: COG3014 family protein [Phycisphaeraceae bacterium JB051]
MFLLCACFLTGCQSNATLRHAQQAYRTGNLQLSSSLINDFINKEGRGVDRVIAHLEQGTIRRELGDLQGSQASFRVADQAIEQIDNKPDVSVSEEVYASVTNMNNLVYRGYDSDRVMLSVYRALNQLQLGDYAAARVHLIRSYNRQVDAVNRNAKRIEKAQQSASNVAQKKNVNVSRTSNDPAFSRAMSNHYANIKQYNAYADYVNPFAEWMQGLFFFADAADGSDMERARKSMQRVSGMVPSNRYVQDDLKMLEAIQANKQGITPMTYVIFATGVAPSRGEFRLDIPVFLFAKDVDYVGANFPTLQMHPNFLRQLNVNVQGQRYGTQLVADMDSIIAQEFENELPVTITRTIISAASKAAIAYGLRQTVKDQNSWEALAIRLAAGAYQVATNEADQRCWATLPKQFQVARFPTPSDRVIHLDDHAGSPAPVTLIPGKINVVFVRSIAPHTPMTIMQFSFGKGSSTWQTALNN